MPWRLCHALVAFGQVQIHENNLVGHTLPPFSRDGVSFRSGGCAQLAALKKELATERSTVIRDLHVQAGYSSREDLITALTNLEGPNGRRAGRRADDAKDAKRRKPRAVVTNKVRKGVVAAVKAGGTNQAVAERFGLSSQTVHNIKAAAGLVNRRK